MMYLALVLLKAIAIVIVVYSIIDGLDKYLTRKR